jgi:mRNA interferase MazF
MFLKNFLDWFQLKPKLDSKQHKTPLVSQGQLWWCSLGENIGTEISGKGDKFTRPVIILQKLSHFTILIIPCSTKIKEGSWFVSFAHRSVDMVACLNQIRIIDYRRLDDKIGSINSKDFDRIKVGFNNLFIQKICPSNSDEDKGTQENLNTNPV